MKYKASVSKSNEKAIRNNRKNGLRYDPVVNRQNDYLLIIYTSFIIITVFTILGYGLRTLNIKEDDEYAI